MEQNNDSTFKNANGEATTANQAYRVYLTTTADVPKKTFKEWIEWNKTGKQQQHSASGNDKPIAPVSTENNSAVSSNKFLGMPKPLAWGVGIGLSAAAVWGIVILVKHLSKPKEGTPSTTN